MRHSWRPALGLVALVVSFAAIFAFGLGFGAAHANDASATGAIGAFGATGGVGVVGATGVVHAGDCDATLRFFPATLKNLINWFGGCPPTYL